MRARSLRLSRKLDGYLQEINSDTWRQDYPDATADSQIIVRWHPDSDPVIPRLLSAYGEWVMSLGAVLVVEELETGG